MTTRDRTLERKELEMRKGVMLDYLKRGYNQKAIAKELNISESVVSRTLKSLKAEARAKQAQFIEQELPLMHEVALDRISSLIVEAYEEMAKSDDKGRYIEIIADLTMKQVSLLSDPEAITQAINKVAKLRRQQQVNAP